MHGAILMYLAVGTYWTVLTLWADQPRLSWRWLMLTVVVVIWPLLLYAERAESFRAMQRAKRPW